MSEDLQGFWLGRHSGVIGETALDAGGDVLKPSIINVFQKKREFKGWVWAIAEIDPALLSDEIERVNPPSLRLTP